MVKISKQLAPVRPGVNCFGYGNPKSDVTVHQTGNESVGANARMHANLQSRVYGASWHWQVDDKEAIQSFPHSVQCWHASDGTGPGNTQSIAVEMCINADGDYVQSVKNGAELVAYICKTEGIPLSNIHQHNHWDTIYRKNCPAQIRAGKAGITWDKFLDMVKQAYGGNPVTTPKPQSTGGKSDEQLADEVLAGLHGNGEARKQSLGSRYNAVQAIVNQRASGKQPSKQPAKKSEAQIVQEVIDGKHGNGQARKNKLQSMGYDANRIQRLVNERLLGKPKVAKSDEQLADEVLAGKHGNGETRKRSLGSRYNAVQAIVNRKASGQGNRKSESQIVQEVIDGKHGNGQARFDKLRKMGYDPQRIQNLVNKRLLG